MKRIYPVILAVAVLIVIVSVACALDLSGDNAVDLQAIVSALNTGNVSTQPTSSIFIDVLTPSPTIPASSSQASKSPEATASATAKATTNTATKTNGAATAEPGITAPTASGNTSMAASASANIKTEALAFKVSASKYYSSYGFSSNHYKYTEAEVKMLAIVIHMEARGEPYRAKLAIANVIMNRVLAPGYPGSTIKEVVTRPNQFCYRATVNPSADCIRAARDVLEYEAWVVPQNTYFFRATSSKSNWGRHEYWGKIGGTTFYQDRYSGRYNGDAVPSRLFERTYKWPQYGCKPAARVRKVQIMLNSLGYKAAADGYFGLDTKKALMKFQAANGLAADGIAGPSTINALIRKYGLSRYLKL